MKVTSIDVAMLLLVISHKDIFLRKKDIRQFLENTIIIIISLH